MASFLPITLVGDNLGLRHRHLNSLVREAKESGGFQDVETLPEESPVDRIFKIDLAIELRNIDYIIRNLKDDDMLYVSRALKSTWLLGHRDIINPKYLEDVLFPEMVTPAVTKMKHWLFIKLRDPAMCQEFYQQYKENSFEFAIKFLSHCSHEFILEEVPKILPKLSTQLLRVLCEKCPKVAKIYFDSLASDEDVKTRYLRQDQNYFNSVKSVLKSDADVFLDITEKYFNMNCFSRFSPLATDYILRCHKTRFTKKLELYVAYFLHIPSLAARLSVEECQEVVLKLARASYLQRWFQYKTVEPLIKRLSPDNRAAFKKRVFVDKDVGECENKWPYAIPAPPTGSDTGYHIFDDQEFMSLTSPMSALQSLAMCDAAARPCAMQPRKQACMNMARLKTDLDRLFDEFRFVGFDCALHELGQRLGATSSPDRRRDIFLVLVSKSGGRTDAVSAMLCLAARYSNEPPHIRASILRSLVKRANVWRLPADDWQHFLDFGHGLGLDGTPSEAACLEGLHAVVIRQLLAGECEQAIRLAFFKQFSTLAEYSLKVDERVRVAVGLQNLLTDAAIDVEPAVAKQRLWQLLDVVKIYRIQIDATSPAVKAVVALALRDAVVARPLLERLYNARIARRELLKLNLEFRKDEAALLNALRHDPSSLDPKRVADILAGPQNDFGSFAPQATVFSSFTAQPAVLGGSCDQPTGFGSSSDRPTGFGSSADQPAVPDGPADQPTAFVSSTDQPAVLSGSADQPTVFVSSADQPTVLGSSADQLTGSVSSSDIPVGFGSSADQVAAVGASTDKPLVLDNSANQPTSFVISSDQHAGFVSSADKAAVLGSSADKPTVFVSSAYQSTVIGSRPGYGSFNPRQPPHVGFGCYRPKRFGGFATSHTRFDRFTSKLMVYFDHKQAFTTNLRTALEAKIAQQQKIKFARPLASLMGHNFEKELRKLDSADKKNKKFAAALKACGHRARPVVNLAEWGWRKAGVRAVATRAMRCREIERTALTRALAAERRTVRVALALSMRSAGGLLLDTFASAAKLRPAVALHAALPYFRRHGANSDLRVWNIVKPLFSSVDLVPRERLRQILGRTDWIPSTIKGDYCVTYYLAFHKISSYGAQTVLRDLSKLLPEIDESIETILLQMLDDTDKDIPAILYPSIFVRYLLLSRNEEDVERRFVKIGNRFLERLDTLRCENAHHFQRTLNDVLESLKYNSAFLDTKISSCLSVIKRFLTWLQNFMPKEKHFEVYMQIHLTMLYYKAVRQSMEQMPEVFSDLKRRNSEGVETVGYVFGRYIVKEVAKLVTTYFDSIVDLYADALVSYLNSHIMYGTSRTKFIGFVLKGILTETVGIQGRMAVYVFRDHQIGIEESLRKEIKELIMKDDTLQLFAHAELFGQVGYRMRQPRAFTRPPVPVPIRVRPAPPRRANVRLR